LPQKTFSAFVGTKVTGERIAFTLDGDAHSIVCASFDAGSHNLGPSELDGHFVSQTADAVVSNDACGGAIEAWAFIVPRCGHLREVQKTSVAHRLQSPNLNF